MLIKGNLLNSTSFRRTTSVMRQRSNVNNLRNLDTGTMHGSDSRLTSVTRTLNVRLYLSQTQVIRNLCAILSCHLCGIRRVLLRTSESHFSGRRPRNNLAFTVGQRNNNVVERRMNVQLAVGIHLYISLFCCNCFFCHINTYYLVAFFLLATVFFLPLRVRALFLVLCPRTGKPIRWRTPR